MFLDKYVDDFYYEQIMDSYPMEYLLNLNEKNFISIYNLLKTRGFYYIEDIILLYLEIFMMDIKIVNKKLDLLKEELGDNYISIIGTNMQYLSNIIE